MTSVERIKQYGNLETEAHSHLTSKLMSVLFVPFGWPQEGVLCFENITLTYIKGHAPSLKQISFRTHAMEKVWND